MKDIRLVANSKWIAIALIISSLVIAVAAIFITLQYNKTQWDIANLQKEVQIKASKNVQTGLEEIGQGVCRASRSSVIFC